MESSDELKETNIKNICYYFSEIMAVGDFLILIIFY